MEQSARERAWDDTKKSFHSIKFFWGVEVVMVAIFGGLAVLLTPENADKFTSAIYPAIGVVSGAVVGLGVIYLIMLFVAPYKQRNEARRLLSEIPSKRKVIANKLADYYISGREISLMIAEDSFKGDVVSLVQDWAKPLMDYCYSEPDILGKSTIARLSPRVSDWGIFGTDRLSGKDRDYAFRDLSIKLEKLLDLIMEIDK